jgi:hypothetical protein
LITQMIFGEKYRAWSSWSCSILHSPVTSTPFRQVLTIIKFFFPDFLPPLLFLSPPPTVTAVGSLVCSIS